MIQSVRALLHIRNMEDFKGIKYIFYAIIISFLFFLSTGGLHEKILAHLFTLFWISINVCQLCTIFKRKKCEHIFLQTTTINYKVLFLFIVSIIENLAFLIFIIVHIIYFMNGSFLQSVLFAIVYFNFSIAVGMLLGNLCKYPVSLIVIALFYGRCFLNSSWTTDEHFRYVSPTLQLYNVHVINTTNLFSLILISIVFVMIVKYLLQRHERKIKFKTFITICISIVLYMLLIFIELRKNEYINNSKFNIFEKNNVFVMYKGISDKNVLPLTNILSSIADELQKLGVLDKSNQYVFNRYYVSYLYFLYETRPIPIIKQDDTIYVNVFSDAMLNLDEPELVQDFLERSYTQMVQEVISKDNKYVYQIVEGCREGILRKICIEDKEIYSEQLQEIYDERIRYRLNMKVEKSNYIKKLSNYMYLYYPDELSKLYYLASKEQINSHEEFIQMFEEFFPSISNNKEIQSLIDSISHK